MLKAKQEVEKKAAAKEAKRREAQKIKEAKLAEEKKLAERRAKKAAMKQEKKPVKVPLHAKTVKASPLGFDMVMHDDEEAMPPPPPQRKIGQKTSKPSMGFVTEQAEEPVKK